MKKRDRMGRGKKGAIGWSSTVSQRYVDGLDFVMNI